MINGRKFGVHELWFYYSDEYLYSEDEISYCINTFDTLEEAKTQQKALDIQYLRGLLGLGARGFDTSSECFYALSHFLEKQTPKKTPNWGKKKKGYIAGAPELKIIAYAKSLGWGKKLIKGNAQQGYRLYLPENITDEQLWEIAQLAQASFYKIIEYQSSKSNLYVKMNAGFWPSFAWRHLQQQGLVDGANLWDFDKQVPYGKKRNDGLWLLNPSQPDHFSFQHLNQALEVAIKLIFDHWKTALWQHSFLGKNYLLDWSKSPTLLLNYLKNTSLFDLEETLVTDENLETFKDTLHKLNSKIALEVGDLFYEVKISEEQEVNMQELQGLIELLKVKPFEIVEVVYQINEKNIKNEEESFNQ